MYRGRDPLLPDDGATPYREPLAAWWLGHATVRLVVDGVSILTDPLLRNTLGPLVRHAPPVPPDLWSGLDLALVSHGHHDHLDLASLRRLGGQVPLLVPVGLGGYLERAGFPMVEEVGPGQSIQLQGLSITALEANHSGARLPFGPSTPALEFVIEGERTVFFAGDTALQPAMADLRGAIDLALVPVGGWGPTLRGGHMDAKDGAEAVRLIQPKLAVPVHWGTFWPRGLRGLRWSRFERPGHEFQDRAELVSEAEIVVSRPGSIIALPPHRPAPLRT